MSTTIEEPPTDQAKPHMVLWRKVYGLFSANKLKISRRQSLYYWYILKDVPETTEFICLHDELGSSRV